MKLKLSELKKLEWNPRTIKKEDLDKLTKSIEKFWVIEWRPFLVSNRTGENIIIWGNQRYEVCKKLGIKEVPVHIMEWLSEEEEKEIIIRDNISNWEWDWDILANEWDKEELEEWWLDVQFETVEPEAEEDDFEVDEGIKTDIVLWDLFEIWSHRLLCWDSTNIDDVNKLMNGEKADMVFTDPPFPNNSWIMHEMIVWIEDAFVNARMYCKWIMFWVWDNLQFPPFSESVTSKHIWHKTNWFQAGHFESIYVFHNDWKRHEQLVYSVENVGWENNREEQWNHPTPKPVKLITQILSDIKWNIVLDLFLWSWTTMIWAERIWKKCYWMELDPKYVQTIVNRMIKLDSTLEIKRNWQQYLIPEISG